MTSGIVHVTDFHLRFILSLFRSRRGLLFGFGLGDLVLKLCDLALQLAHLVGVFGLLGLISRAGFLDRGLFLFRVGRLDVGRKLGLARQEVIILGTQLVKGLPGVIQLLPKHQHSQRHDSISPSS